MFKLAKKLPPLSEGVAECFDDKVLPPLVESNLEVVHGLILQAIKEVTDLSIVKVGPVASDRKRPSTWNDRSSAKRGRGAYQQGAGPTRGRGAYQQGAGPTRGR